MMCFRMMLHGHELWIYWEQHAPTSYEIYCVRSIVTGVRMLQLKSPEIVLSS